MLLKIRGIISFYMIGFVVAGLFHAKWGWENQSLWPKAYLIILMILLIALPWTILNISNLICPIKRSRNLAELIVHVIFFSLIIAQSTLT